MTGWKRTLRAVVLLSLLLAVYFVVPVTTNDEGLVTRIVVTVIALAVLTAVLVWQVVLHADDPHRQIDGLLLALVAAVLVFALAFYRLEMTQPGEIAGLETRVDSLYFTLSTLITVGFGDVHAVGQTARVLVIIAMVFNVAVIATAATTITGRMRMRVEERAEMRRSSDRPPPHRPRLVHRPHHDQE